MLKRTSRRSASGKRRGKDEHADRSAGGQSQLTPQDDDSIEDDVSHTHPHAYTISTSRLVSHEQLTLRVCLGWVSRVADTRRCPHRRRRGPVTGNRPDGADAPANVKGRGGNRQTPGTDPQTLPIQKCQSPHRVADLPMASVGSGLGKCHDIATSFHAAAGGLTPSSGDCRGSRRVGSWCSRQRPPTRRRWRT